MARDKMNSSSSEKGRPSKAAAVLAVLYLLLVVAALALLLLAGEHDTLAGIYFILVTFPWPSLLMWVTATFGIDSMAFNTLFLLVGGLLNALILYGVVGFLSRRIVGR